MGVAKELIRLAKENGADLAKFQLYDHVKLGDPKLQEAELSFVQAKMLFEYGEEIGIEVFFSVFDIERLRWCEEIGVKRYKIAYRERDNLDLLTAIWATEKPFMMSSDKPTFHSTLYCISKYPTTMADLNLGNVSFDIFDGFSDHTIGLDAAKIALSRGAEIIEKHFALDHQMGIDAPWSMITEELEELKRFELAVKEAL